MIPSTTPVLRTRHFIALFCVWIASGGCAILQTRHTHAVTTGAHWRCAAPTSDIADRLRKWIISYSAPQSALADTVRMQYQLPRVRPESVTVISLPRICDQAGLAYAREANQRLSPGVYEMAVIGVGNRYVVRGVAAPARGGEWNMITIFDRGFHFKSGIFGF